MWLLECEGEVLGGKKLWLKPGNKYVMGRVSSPEVNLPMPSQKSISRVHLVVEVGNVAEGDGLKLHHRSAITVQDCKTKHGTRLDGEEMRNETRTLEGDEHFFHLGKYEPGFRLFWKPVVISVSLSSKERKDKKAMSPYQKKVEALDIKTIGAFVPETTHVVATKRNTAAGLQALINSRCIVTPSYLDAIVKAAAIPPGGSVGGVVRSPLETDFEGNWSNPEDYLPPYTNEPKDREAWRFRPNEKRQSLFEGYNFIVCERAQYDNFLGPITNAHGKLEKYDLEPRKTTAEDLVQFVRKRERGSQVVMVRFLGKKDPEWEIQLSTEVQEMLGFRMIEQNEFLDIIVMCDKSRLRVPLREQATSAALPSVQVSSRSSRIPDSPPFKPAPAPMVSDGVGVGIVVPQKPTQPAQVSVRGRGRVRTRAKAFDPFAIDPSEFKPPPTQGPPSNTSQMAGLQDYTASLPSAAPRTQVSLPDDGIVTRGSARQDTRQNQQSSGARIEVDRERNSAPIQQSNVGLSDSHELPLRGVSRKRSMPPEDEHAKEPFDVMDMLPGAKAVKRRKVAEEEERIRRGETIIEEPPPGPIPTPIPEPVKVAEKAERESLKGKGRKVLKEKEEKDEDPYVTRTREIKEKEEEEARVAKEEELAAMDGLEVEKMRNLAIVEIMEVKPRTDRPVRDQYGDEGARWDDKWNGRKNFKKFRRQGRGGGMRTMRGSVMVNLVEHKGKDYGIGDGYWVDNDEGNKSSKKQSQKSIPILAADDSESDQGDTLFRPAQSQPTGMRSATQTQTSSSGVKSQAASADTTSRGTKRGAPTAQMGRTGGGKKQKTLLLRDESGSEDESEDELKFRFRRSNRR